MTRAICVSKLPPRKRWCGPTHGRSSSPEPTDPAGLRAAARHLFFGATGPEEWQKLFAEAELVKKGITADTVADLLLFADANNCALLKEACGDFFVANTHATMSSESWPKVEESAKLLSELMERQASGNHCCRCCLYEYERCLLL